MDFYNHTRKLFANGDVTLANLKVMLYGDSYSFDPTETNMTAVEADEVSGNGWTQGGEAIGSAAVTVDDTNEAKLDGNDISKTASGSDIGPAHGLVVFDATGADDTAWLPLFHYAFASPQTAGVGTDFKITWHADGIATWDAPA